jgi:deoxyhypusine synthase
VPKDTIQLVTVMVSRAQGGEDAAPHKYAVQITTDSPQWGGLSGCTFEEAISWGKIDEAAVRAVCYCDATIALPILAHALLERGVRRTNPPDLSWLGTE